MVRKYLSVIMLALVCVVAVTGAAVAAEKIAIIDPQKVLFNHPKFQDTQKQIQAMMDKKQQETKMAMETVKAEEEQRRIFMQKRQEAAIEEQKMMEGLFKDIDMAIRVVAQAKGFTLVLDKNQVFFGGVDITNDVILELNKKK
ncbi:periplasmic chaperone for outer membrane proteins Skp [Acetomicrobium thermoterrenum DSM 13490]|uniref:Periplasmic chaperone for outer membrane proteins Skp n=1 Tax=Acetomicrobium thermoterrenum DSM 13490 TaxID=1120987 RepID=A0A1H3DJ11_9BACT|nr:MULTISPECIES: OmpH family outer membrane protein [Acetomicrobium]SDX66502.1 periplasmic chaperone for outer membrane proteins Skp [Acetomicrobium thermoterrenum DSM 13490]